MLGWVTYWSSPQSVCHAVPVEIILSNRPKLLSCQPGPDLVDLVLAMALIIKHVDISFMLIMHQTTLLLTKKWKKISWEACPYRPSRVGSWSAFYYSLFPNNTNAMAYPLSCLCHKAYWLFTSLMFIFRWTEYQWHALIKWTKWC